MDGERLAAFLASSGIQQRQNLILTLVEQHNWCMRAAKIQVAERYAEKLREAQQAAKERAEAEAALGVSVSTDEVVGFPAGTRDSGTRFGFFVF